MSKATGLGAFDLSDSGAVSLSLLCSCEVTGDSNRRDKSSSSFYRKLNVIFYFNLYFAKKFEEETSIPHPKLHEPCPVSIVTIVHY